MKIGMILLAYGSPENLDEMADFLEKIRGQPFPPEVVARFRSRYEQTGGPSPLNSITRAQAKGLADIFEKEGFPYPVFVGMAYCPPWIADGVRNAHQAEVEHLVGLPMAPHYSSLSTGKYQRFFQEACEKYFPAEQTSTIESWYQEEGVVAFFVREVQALLDKLGNETPVLFTAHSLPKRVLQDGDPYFQQIQENAAAIAQRLHLPQTQWNQVWQSKGYGKEPWFEPSAEEFLQSLPEEQIEKYRNLIVCPIGFACDHIEILYDIDIELKQIAETKKIRLHRTPSLNTDGLFLNALARRVHTHLNALGLE